VLLCQANLNLQNFDEAVWDFRAVLEVDPDNKAAKNQLIITNHKLKQIHDREKQTYAGMFQKFAEIDAKVSRCLLHVFSVRMFSSPHLWSRNKINSVLATIYFISAPSVHTCGAEII